MDRILVVDDKLDILELCRRVLQDKYIVETTTDGNAALKMMSENTYDVLLTDLKMPEMDGVELLKRAKVLSPDTEVIVFTGQATIDTALETMKGGAYDYILKPFNIQDLLSTIQKCVTQSKLKIHDNVFRETIYLYQFAGEMISKQDESELLKFILERAAKALRADTGSILLFQPEKNTLSLVAHVGSVEPLVKESGIDQGVAGWVAKSKEALLIQDGFKNQPQLKSIPVRKEIVSSMVAPLLSRDLLIGIICLNRYVEKSNFLFTERDLDLFKMFTSHSSLVLLSIRNTQALRELNELKTNFVANVSHELKTPLMAISGALELMEDERSPDKIKTYMDLLSRNSLRMKSLVYDLLDFSKLDSKQLRLQPIEFSLNRLINETIEDLAVAAKEKGLELSASTPGDEISILADHERIKQVVSNLIANALKFTPEKGSIRVDFSAQDDGTVLISVKDTGIGIGPAEQMKVFDKFYQVDGSPSRAHAGFGLGLAIVSSIVEAHGGKIWVESELGKGSAFFVSLPLKYAAAK
jgi:signal transduction histidine kinase/DNA-binding response OmpR family regulator